MKLLFTFIIGFVVTGCVNFIEPHQVQVSNVNFSEIDIHGNVLLLKPIVQHSEFNVFAYNLGEFLQLELTKKIRGNLVYSQEVPALEKTIIWSNLMKNGIYNVPEILEIAKTLKCDSVIVCKLQSINNYSPFRAMLNMEWIDVSSGQTLARLKNDADLKIGVTKNSFNSFVKKEDKYIYEKILSNEDSYQTASLKPRDFQSFLAFSSIEALFSKNNDKNDDRLIYNMSNNNNLNNRKNSIQIR